MRHGIFILLLLVGCHSDEDYTMYHAIDCFADSSYVDVVGELNPNKFAILFVTDTILQNHRVPNPKYRDTLHLIFSASKYLDAMGKMNEKYFLHLAFKRCIKYGDTIIPYIIPDTVYVLPYNNDIMHIKILIPVDTIIMNICDTVGLITMKKPYICFCGGYVRYKRNKIYQEHELEDSKNKENNNSIVSLYE